MARYTSWQRTAVLHTPLHLPRPPPASSSHSPLLHANGDLHCAPSAWSRENGHDSGGDPLPDHLVAEIFLRLPTAEDLARAAAACVSFRRIVADKAFLRRFRSLHDPPLLAFYDRDGFHPALPPHPSAPAADALAAAADGFSFVPNHREWSVQDIRDGRVLLLRPGPAGGKQPQVSMELAVCDPLHHKYVLLPPVPDDLAASMGHTDTGHKPWCETFLVPLDDDAEAAFGVLWMAHFDTKLAALVFSSNTGQWQAGASKQWSELFLGRSKSTMVSPIDSTFHSRHYAYGSFYWESIIVWKKELLVLDTHSMEFSISDLPPGEWCRCTLGLAIVETEEGRLGLFGIPRETVAGQFDLSYYIKEGKGEISSEWQLENTISLGSGCQYDIRAATGRYLLIGKFGVLRFTGSTPKLPDREYISVDIKTFQLERVCSKSSGFAMSKTWIYANFPPSLSSPTI